MSPDSSVPREDALIRLLASCHEQLQAGPLSGIAEGLPDPTQQAHLPEIHNVVQLLRQVLSADRSTAHASSAETDPSGTPGEGTVLPQELPGQLGPFEIIRILGQGGFGLVYLANDSRLHREVALKVPRLEVLLDPALRQRFLHEACIAAHLDHPNIVPVLEVGEAAGIAYIATAYCPGPTLATWLRAQPTSLSPRAAAALVQVLAAAVAYTHSRSVLHRDLKPGNIILHQPDGETTTPNGQLPGVPGTPRICDFGLARILDRPSSNDTQRCRWIGTPAYMAPEQAAGRVRDIGVTTDVYGLGAILYELLTGRPPFQGDSDQEVVQQVMEANLEPPRKLRKEVPADLEAICLKCLEKDPQSRYPQALDLEADLQRFLQGEPTHARPLGPVQHLHRWVRRKPLLASLIGVILLSLLGAITSITIFSVHLQTAFSNLHAREKEVEQYEENLRLHQYSDDLRLAAQALQSHNRPRALGLLQAFLPTPGQPDLRTFPWGYLWQQCHGEDGVLSGHQGDVYHLAFSPDGQLLATTGKDGWIFLWNVRSGTRVRSWQAHPTEANHLAFSPDGQTLASSSDDHTIRLWEVATGQLRQTLLGHQDEVYQIEFTGDGRNLVSISADGEVLLWNLPGGEKHTLFHIDREQLDVALITPDARQLILATADRHIACHDLQENKLVWQFDHREDRVRQLAWHPASQTLATTMRNNSAISLWNPTLGTLRARYRVLELSFSALAFSPDGNLLVAGFCHGGFRVWDTRTNELLGTWHGHNRRIWHLAFDPEGKFLLSAGGEGLVKRWETSTLRTRRPITVDNFLGALALVPGKPWLVLGTWNRDSKASCAIEVWDYKSGTRQHRCPLPNGEVQGLAIRPQDQTLYVGHSTGQVFRYRLPDLVSLPPLSKEHGLYIPAVSPDGRWLALAGHDRVHLWDLHRQERVRTIHGKVTVVKALTFSPDSTLLAWSGNEGWIHLWDLEAGQALGDWSGKTTAVQALAFSPDGQLLGSAGEDGIVRLWDWHRGKVEMTLAGHPQTVYHLHFSPDGKVLASCDRLKGKLWDLRTGEEVLRLDHASYYGPILRFHLEGDLLFQVWNNSSKAYVFRYRGPVD